MPHKAGLAVRTGGETVIALLIEIGSFAVRCVVLTMAAWMIWVVAAGLVAVADAFTRVLMLRGWTGVSRTWSAARGGDGHAGAPGVSACALGAVPRRGWARREVLRHVGGHRLMVGEAAATQGALAAAIASWDGGVVVVGRFGFADRLPLRDAVRFSPGRRDSAQLNPLLMIRAGAHAARDARVLASGLVGAEPAAVDLLAALLRDQLATAPADDRTLAALRLRLLTQEGAQLSGRVHMQTRESGWTGDRDIARIGHWQDAQAEGADAALKTVRRALAPFADGRFEDATNTLDLRLCDPAALGTPRALVMEAPPGDEITAGGLFAALLGQLIAQLTDAGDTDHWGRAKHRPVLLVLDDPDFLPGIPLLAKRLRDASPCGLELLVRAPDCAGLASLVGARTPLDALGVFGAVAAVGGQSRQTAEALSAHTGTEGRIVWSPCVARWWGWLLPIPTWRRAPRLATRTIECLDAHQVMLFGVEAPPLRARALEMDGASAPQWSAAPKPAPAHAWTGPPAPQPDVKPVAGGATGARRPRRLAPPPNEAPQLPLDDPAAALGVSMSARRGRAV